jgi:hypothetical protein
MPVTTLLGKKRWRGSWFKASPGKKLVRPPPISTNKWDMAVYICKPNYKEAQVGRSQSEASPEQNKRSYLKNKAKGAEGMAQVVDCLLSKPQSHKKQVNIYYLLHKALAY